MIPLNSMWNAMDFQRFWFENKVRILIAIGILAVVGFGVYGMWWIIRRETPRPGDVATVTGTPPPAATTTDITAATATPPISRSGPPQPVPVPSAPQRTLGAPKTTVYPVRGSGARILPNGVSDLRIRVLDVGYLDSVSGIFHATSSISRAEQAAISFEVENIGTAVSLSWDFMANLPTDGGTFRSEQQPSLAPGDGVRFTVGFLHLAREGENIATFTLDPDNRLRDADRANDTATATLQRYD